MPNNRRPRLRTVERHTPPYPLNQFPSTFYLTLGREITYLLLTRGTARLEGQDWEEIFSRSIGGRWKPSNVGLDDVLLETTAWSAKTVKSKNPALAKKIRLICGRNSPSYSFDRDEILSANPNLIGAEVLSIWNERVAAVRSKYHHLRTVVLMKSDDLLELAVFEYETVLYLPELFDWRWNKRKNLEGFLKGSNDHQFTWQPHGSQFTIVEKVPNNRIAFRIKQPPDLDRAAALETIGFNDSWIELIE